MATTCIISLGAFAQDPELYFYPAKRWNVSQTQVEGQGETCTIANEFNNGFVMQLAGTKDGFTNINIDFRQPTFEAGKKYEVVYNFPDSTTQIIPSTAFKQNLLTADLRDRPDFAKTLAHASVIDFGIMENSFRFYLTGFAQAMDEYNNCVSPPAEVALADDPLEPVTDDLATLESPSVDSELPTQESASKDLASASPQEPISSSDELSSLIPSSDDASSALAPLPEDKSSIVTKASAMADDFKAEHKSESENNSKKAVELVKDKVSSNDKSFEDKPRLTEELAQQIKDEGNSLQDDSSAQISPPEEPQSPQKETISFLSERVLPKKSNITAKNDVPAKNLDPKSATSDMMPFEDSPAAEPIKTSVTIPAVHVTKSSSRMEADLTKFGLEEKNASNSNPDIIEAREVKALDAPAIEPAGGPDANEFVDMRNKISDLEKQIYKLEAENKSLDEELRNSLKDSEQERLSVSSDNWNLERATMRYNEAERQITRLGRQLQSEKARCDQEKQDLEAMLFDPKVTEQQQLAKLASLEEELDKAKEELQIQQRKYDERIKILEEQLNTSQ